MIRKIDKGEKYVYIFLLMASIIMGTWGVILLLTGYDTASICGDSKYYIGEYKDYYKCCKNKEIKHYLNESNKEYIAENKIVCFEVKKNE